MGSSDDGPGGFRLGRRTRSALLIVAGSIALAVGVGLAPHLLAADPTILSILSVVTIVGGGWMIVSGARVALDRARRLGRTTLTVVATVVFAGCVVWMIAPVVAATNVPPSDTGETPADVGLSSRSVTVTTADDVALAAWYLPGSNGAGVVVRHGAGSTRSDVLHQAAVLDRNGYSVLMLDARGHGDSEGTAMDFGWFGDLDIAAGTAFLAEQPEVEVGRIGVVGLSMGGEEAIGAAATDPLISAVVAEGATGRQVADKGWYSEAYGARGWLQEQIERVQTAVTDVLTDASPPTPLARAAANSPAAFLLITAGDVPDEAHAAAAIQRAAPTRVTTWNVDGAGHTDGLRTNPGEWQTRVVRFLDAHLR